MYSMYDYLQCAYLTFLCQWPISRCDLCAVAMPSWFNDDDTTVCTMHTLLLSSQFNSFPHVCHECMLMLTDVYYLCLIPIRTYIYAAFSSTIVILRDVYIAQSRMDKTINARMTIVTASMHAHSNQTIPCLNIIDW